MSEEIRKRIEEKAKEYSQQTINPEYKGMEVYMAQDFYMGAEFGYQLAQEDQPNQDELWEQIAQSIITHVQVMPELKSQFTIKRN